MYTQNDWRDCQTKKNDELFHHGILGQKWGVRRYQNKDGSLTSAGKKRYKYNIAVAIDGSPDMVRYWNYKVKTDKPLSDQQQSDIRKKLRNSYADMVSKEDRLKAYGKDDVELKKQIQKAVDPKTVENLRNTLNTKYSDLNEEDRKLGQHFYNVNKKVINGVKIGALLGAGAGAALPIPFAPAIGAAVFGAAWGGIMGSVLGGMGGTVASEIGSRSVSKVGKFEDDWRENTSRDVTENIVKA